MEKSPEYSIVVPVYNEEGNIENLDKEIKQVMNKLGSYETIYINDESTDNTLLELKKLKNVKIIELNRNYGKLLLLMQDLKQQKEK